MAYGLIEKSGCEVWHGGLVKVMAEIIKGGIYESIIS